MSKIDDWPLSLRELETVGVRLHPKISFLDIVRSYSSRVDGVWHSEFTHKANCPFHSNGQERTPSLYFSETTKKYHCFACTEHGDVYDFLGRMEGSPRYFIIRDLVNSSDVDTLNIDLSEDEPYESPELAYELNIKMGIKLRDYLLSLKGKDCYDCEKQWVDNAFIRIDNKMNDDCSFQEKNAFRMQLLLELDRRNS